MKLDKIVSRDPGIVSGELCFTGTCVLAQSLIDHLKAGDSLEDFLDGFPSVSREQAEAFLEFAYQSAVLEVDHAPVLLDEQLHNRHRFDFSAWIQATTVEFQGWKGTKNGDLLHLAAQQFDAFITMDRGIEYQQNRRASSLIIVVLFAKTNRYVDVKPLIPLLEEVLSTAQPGQLLHVPALPEE